MCFVHIIGVMFFQGDGPLVSEYWSTEIPLNKEQKEHSFHFVPKNINAIQQFGDATQGIWFERIKVIDDTLYLDNIGLHVVDMISFNKNGKVQYWERSFKQGNITTLTSVPKGDKISIGEYVLHHIWIVFFLIALFLGLSFLVDKYFNKRYWKWDLLLISSYLFYLYSIFF
jgi:hypothetical protein